MAATIKQATSLVDFSQVEPLPTTVSAVADLYDNIINRIGMCNQNIVQRVAAPITSVPKAKLAAQAIPVSHLGTAAIDPGLLDGLNGLPQQPTQQNILQAALMQSQILRVGRDFSKVGLTYIQRMLSSYRGLRLRTVARIHDDLKQSGTI